MHFDCSKLITFLNWILFYSFYVSKGLLFTTSIHILGQNEQVTGIKSYTEVCLVWSNMQRTLNISF